MIYVLLFLIGVAAGHRAGMPLAAVAIGAWLGWIDPAQSIYTGPRVIWLSAMLGGALFGFGMVLASGCGSKTLVRIGAGSLKSLVVFFVMGIAAFATLRGVTAVLLARFRQFDKHSPAGAVERVVWIAISAGSAAAIFFFGHAPLLYLFFPVGLMVVLRLSPPVSQVAILAFAMVAAGATVFGFGPLADYAPDMNQRILGLQLYLASLQGCALVLTSVLTQRSRAQHALRRALATARQTRAMAIPTGHIRRVFAQQCLRADDHVLQNMVQRMADMHVAIRVWRAIMQNELLTPATAIAQLRIKILRLPTRENARFLLRKASLHREICFRQENGVAIVDRVSHVVRVPKGYGAANKACIRAVARTASCGDDPGAESVQRTNAFRVTAIVYLSVHCAPTCTKSTAAAPGQARASAPSPAVRSIS
eukprot:gene31134-41481_t